MTTAQDLLQKNYPTVDVKDTIAQLKATFKKIKHHSALVFDGKKYLGVVSKRFLLNSRIDPTNMKVGNIIKKRSKSKTQFYVPTLEPETDLRKICKLMATSDSHILPVMKKNQVIGIVTIKDVLTAIADEYKNATCEELSNKPTCAKGTDNLDTALDIFSRQGIDHLPIIDDQNRLAGMVSLTDLIDSPNIWNLKAQKISGAAKHQQGKKTGYGGRDKLKATNLPIKNFLSKKPICCTPPETKISNAVKQMKEQNVTTIILVKYDQPVGIMTAKDLLKDYAK